ncbi:MAG: alpha-L-fucosidase [Bdellovibrionaceae bacterium]|nr:alpha-L-fucosidase [Pseudobdellovibrionaceae bacterium]
MNPFKPYHTIRRIVGSTPRLQKGFGCILLWAVIGLGSCGPLADTEPEAAGVTEPEASPDPYALETPAQRDARMAWWREARFGMFIHWGVYAVPAGTFQGKQIPGIGEWILLRGKIPVSDYKGFAQQFNPVQYDPKAWARLAKQAGMRYMVITSKHHDGFALFPSDATQWDVADATPYGKDLIGPLAEAPGRKG